MEEDTEIPVFLLGKALCAVFLCELFDGERAVAMLVRMLLTFWQAVRRELDRRGAAIFNGEKEAVPRCPYANTDAARILCLMLLCVYGILKEVAEKKGEVDLCGECGGGVDLYVDGDVFFTCLLHIDGKGGIDHGVLCKVFDACCVNLIVETLDELYGCFILAACDEIGKHFRVVAEIMANDRETCLLVL